MNPKRGSMTTSFQAKKSDDFRRKKVAKFAMNPERPRNRCVTGFALLAFLFLILISLRAVQAQYADFTMAHEGDVYGDNGALAGSDKILWRLRLSQTEANYGQSITIFLDLNVQRWWFMLPPISYYEEIEVDTNGLTAQPLTYTMDIFSLGGQWSGSPASPSYKATGTISFEFTIPVDKDWNARYVFQAKNQNSGWTPSNSVTLDVLGNHPPPPTSTGQKMILIGTIVVIAGGALVVTYVFGVWSLPAVVGRSGATVLIRDIVEQLLHPEGRYVPHVDLISPKDMDAIHKYLALTKNARGEILKELPPDKVKQILDGLPKE
jgi:hypothetical protein